MLCALSNRQARVLLGVAALSWPACSSAQQGTVYRWTVGDTLRYREVATSDAVLSSAQGLAPIVTRHAATIALRFVSDDSVEAWYEELLVESSDSRGAHRPDATPVVRQPFALRFDDRGRVETLDTPDFPEEFTQITDLSRQFNDFFLRLPGAPALDIGREWRDTVMRADTNATGQYYHSSNAIHFRVETDTVVAGRPSFVVRATQQVRLEFGGPTDDAGIVSRSLLEGQDDGIFVFDARGGMMLARRREAELSGTLRFTGGPQPLQADQRFRYTNVVEAVR